MFCFYPSSPCLPPLSCCPLFRRVLFFPEPSQSRNTENKLSRFIHKATPFGFIHSSPPGSWFQGLCCPLSLFSHTGKTQRRDQRRCASFHRDIPHWSHKAGDRRLDEVQRAERRLLEGKEESKEKTTREEAGKHPQ